MYHFSSNQAFSIIQAECPSVLTSRYLIQHRATNWDVWRRLFSCSALALKLK